MKLRRLLLNLLCVGSLLMQTTAFAWTPLSALPEKTATEHAMPCHGGAPMDQDQDQHATHKCCCDDHCSCKDFCTGTSAVLPGFAAGLDQLIAAHFEAVRVQPAPLSTTAHPRFRPPISHPG